MAMDLVLKAFEISISISTQPIAPSRKERRLRYQRKLGWFRDKTEKTVISHAFATRLDIWTDIMSHVWKSTIKLNRC